MSYQLSLRPTGKHRKQRATNYSVTINGLMTHRSLLISEKPDSLAEDLAAIDYVLKLCGFNEDPQQYMPKLRKRQIFKKGEKLRLVLQALREADRPLTSREICLAILAGKDFDFTDKRRLNQTTVGVYNFLCREFENGRVGKLEGRTTHWMCGHAINLSCFGL